MKIKGKFMMATMSWHQAMGETNVGEEDAELCHVTEEVDSHYIGSYIEGIGAFAVVFPKNHCRPLTEDEAEEISKRTYVMGDIKYPKYKKSELLNQ